jgi:hypothetical protein
MVTVSQTAREKGGRRDGERERQEMELQNDG